MREEIHQYVYSLASRKLLIYMFIFSLGMIIAGKLMMTVSSDSIPDVSRSIIGKVCTFQGKISALQVKETYSGEQLVATIKDVKLCDPDKTEYERAVHGDANKRKITTFYQSVQVWFPVSTQVKTGQYVRFEGKVKEFASARNEGQFDTKVYYNNRGCLFAVKDAVLLKYSKEYSRLKQRAFEIRIISAKELDEIYGPEDGPILKAMLLGIKGEIDEDIRESFQKSGAAHILAISGLHISFICMMLIKLMQILGINRYIRVAAGMIFTILYVMMVGSTPSAIRACVMSSLYLISTVIKRSYDIMTAMSAAAFLILITNPGYLYDIGFLLSFAAVFGVGFYARSFIQNSCYIKKLRKLRQNDTISGILHNLFVKYVLDGFVISGIIFLTTMPVLLSSYYEVAFYSVILNLVIIPLMSVLLCSSILGIALTETVGVPGRFFVLVAKGILYIYKTLCGFMEETGIGRGNLGKPHILASVLFYMILIFFCLYRGKHSVQFKVVSLILALIVISFHIHSTASLHMLDVGQGDGLAFFNSNGHVILFDGGSSSKENVGEEVIIPFLKYHAVSEVEAIFLSHPDSDHINGIEQLVERSKKECIIIRKIFVYNGFLASDDYARLLKLCDKSKTAVIGICAGDVFTDGKLRIECLYPQKDAEFTDANNMSLVLRAEYEDFSMLETGDIEAGAEKMILDKEIRADCLKVAHHGSESSTTDEMLLKTDPKIAIISAGINNRYGHPHKVTLDKLKMGDRTVLCTAQTGQISININNKSNIMVETYIPR